MATKAKAPVSTGTAKKRIRKIFGDIHEVVQMPNLIEVQRESYEQFLRSDPATGYVSGLEKTLRSVFPIRDFAGTAELDFVHYELEDPKYDTVECRQRGITYAAPMKVTLRLIVFEVDQETETRSVLDIKEQDVYMGDMPLMTENGTFIVNGTERVIVSQMHRSPGVLFDHDRGKTHSSGKFLFAARVIPYRGSWLDFEFDAKDIVNVRIDRKRKLPVTALLYALGLNVEEILDHFYQKISWKRVSGKAGDGWKIPFVAEAWRGQKPAFALIDAKTGEEVFPAAQKISPRAANKAEKDGLKELLIPTEEIFGRYASQDLIDEKTGRIYIEAGEEVSPENLEKLDKAGVDQIDLLDIDHVNTGPWIRNTLEADKAENREEGLEAIYKVMRPGEPPTKETAEALFEGLFFDAERYDDDPRIAFLQVGFGLWGEYHIYDGPNELGEQFPDKPFQSEFLRHMDASFDALHWSVSIDAGSDGYSPFASDSSLLQLRFGIFDDSFMHERHDQYNESMWDFFGHEQRYLRAAHGGELSYYTDYDQEHALDVGGIHGRTFEALSSKFHITYMIGNDQPDVQPVERIRSASLALGYKFRVTSFRPTSSAGCPSGRRWCCRAARRSRSRHWWRTCSR